MIESFREQFFARGKVLLSGEYGVIFGGEAMAFPTKRGQKLEVKYYNCFEPYLHWQSFDHNGECWLDIKFDLWHFDVFESIVENQLAIEKLQKTLREARKLNPHFLREEYLIQAKTFLDFPRKWGLGTSSTFLYCVAKWAYVDPFELHCKVEKGSGYDIACAGESGPILFSRSANAVNIKKMDFFPKFSSNLYFLYLERKADTETAINWIQRSLSDDEKSSLATKLSEITQNIYNCDSYDEFNRHIEVHENILKKYLNRQTIKEELFSDFPDQIKSLGAWGGDMVLVSSRKKKNELEKYFVEKGHPSLFPFKEFINSNSVNDNIH